MGIIQGILQYRRLEQICHPELAKDPLFAAPPNKYRIQASLPTLKKASEGKSYISSTSERLHVCRKPAIIIIFFFQNSKVYKKERTVLIILKLFVKSPLFFINRRNFGRWECSLYN